MPAVTTQRGKGDETIRRGAAPSAKRCAASLAAAASTCATPAGVKSSCQLLSRRPLLSFSPCRQIQRRTARAEGRRGTACNVERVCPRTGELGLPELRGVSSQRRRRQCGAACWRRPAPAPPSSSALSKAGSAARSASSPLVSSALLWAPASLSCAASAVSAKPCSPPRRRRTAEETLEFQRTAAPEASPGAPPGSAPRNARLPESLAAPPPSAGSTSSARGARQWPAKSRSITVACELKPPAVELDAVPVVSPATGAPAWISDHR
mmetsp:Transcript_39600/g.122223  ORF Transcript_39600/g.122223 Transcript_39600/m.122223 type:complete len:266 (-) Transcript_39600:250-1047(-)